MGDEGSAAVRDGIGLRAPREIERTASDFLEGRLDQEDWPTVLQVAIDQTPIRSRGTTSRPMAGRAPQEVAWRRGGGRWRSGAGE